MQTVLNIIKIRIFNERFQWRIQATWGFSLSQKNKEKKEKKMNKKKRKKWKEIERFKDREGVRMCKGLRAVSQFVLALSHSMKKL